MEKNFEENLNFIFGIYLSWKVILFAPTKNRIMNQMRNNNLLCPLTTLYGNLWNQSMFYASYMTLYDFQEIFSTSKENERYTVFRLWIFLYDPCMISTKSYMILVWLLRNHTNHLYIYIYIYIYKCLHKQLYLDTHASTHVHTHTHAHTHTHTHTHTHKQTHTVYITKD